MKKSGIMMVVTALMVGAAFGSQASSLLLFGNESAAPKAYLKDGKPAGIAVDIMQEAARRAGYQPEVELLALPQALAQTQRGKGMFIHASKTPEREAAYYFTEEILSDSPVLIVKKGKEFDYSSIDDLKGKVVGFTRGAAYGAQWAKAREAGLFEPQEDADEAGRLAKLKQGRIDAAVFISEYALRNLLMSSEGADHKQEDFTILPNPLTKTPNFAMIAKDAANAEELISKINLALKSMRDDGKFKELTDKNLSRAP